MKRCFCNMQGNHIQSTPCVFSLQPSLCAWKYLIWPFRGIPRTRFSNFPSFGTPRRFIFSKNNSSGHPETLFFRISTFRDAPKLHFPRFSLVVCKRNAVFRIFCISLTSDRPLSPFFARRLQAKRCFSHFLHFAHERRTVFSVFCSSLASETLFFAFSAFRSQATGHFPRFSLVAHERRMIFSIFWLSPAGEVSSRCYFIFPHEGKLIFANFLFSPVRES